MATKRKVIVEMLIRAGSRTPEAMEQLQGRIRELGLEVSGTGLATLSAVGDASTIERVFHTTLTPIPPRASRPGDYGRSGGYVESAELTIPASLSDFVDNISIAPTHIRMGDD